MSETWTPMTDEEIVRDYQAAKSPLKQVGILAQLNNCSKERIKEILVAAGCELPAQMRPRPKKAQAAEQAEAVSDAINGAIDVATETVRRGGVIKMPALFAEPRRKSVTLVAFDLICELGDDGILDRSLPGIVALVRALREEGYE